MSLVIRKKKFKIDYQCQAAKGFGQTRCINLVVEGIWQQRVCRQSRQGPKSPAAVPTIKEARSQPKGQEGHQGRQQIDNRENLPGEDL